jgi:hypothetical protein
VCGRFCSVPPVCTVLQKFGMDIQRPEAHSLLCP